MRRRALVHILLVKVEKSDKKAKRFYQKRGLVNCNFAHRFKMPFKKASFKGLSHRSD